MLKSLLQRTLKGLGLYVWFKNESVGYDIYRYFKDGRPITWRGRELRFYRSLLGVNPGRMLIFDVGANRGQRTAVFLKLGAEVVALEPDRFNQHLLARKFQGRLRKHPVTIVGKAVSDTGRVETLWVTSPGSGLNTLSEKWVRTLDVNVAKFGSRIDYPDRQSVETTTLAALMEEFGAPRYIKIDVEGHESRVLRGLPHSVPFVSFEAILPEFQAETNECIQMLCRLSPDGRFNFSYDCYKGLSLREWTTGPEMVSVLGRLGEIAVEVFWKSD